MTLRKIILFSVLFLALLLGAVYFLYPRAVNEKIFGAVEAAREVAVHSGLPSIPVIGSSASREAILTQQGIIVDTNGERTKHGLGALRENVELNHAAQTKLADMFAQQYFDHIAPNGNGPGTLAQNANYAYVTVGENLALGDFKNNEDLVAAWMASPGHRANILNSRFVDIGVAVSKGIYNGKETWIAVQEFGIPSSVCPSINPALKAKIDYDKQQTDNMAAQLDSLKRELDSMPQTTSEDRTAYNSKVNQYNSLVNKYTSLSATWRNEIDDYNSQVRLFNTCLNSNQHSEL
jgi:uncharacterized protein YkwD